MIHTHPVRRAICEEPLPPVLARARELTDGLLYSEISRLHPSMADIGAYHIGRQLGPGDGMPSGNAGKGVCLALPILSAEAVGSDAATGIPGAIALELVHIFTHMHDDIMDGDVQRRHRDSVWKAFGVGPAILTGDALFALSMRVLVAQSRDLRPIRCLVDSCLEIAAGQALDLTYEHRTLEDVDLGRYEHMASGKTGALYGCALSIGAELAGASPTAVETLRTAGRGLGLVAQEVDDINGTWGDPVISGKPVLSDLMRRKKALPAVAVLQAEAPLRRRFLELVDRGVERAARTGSAVHSG
jgi:geranylgeranyl diphosphate synthase type I